MIGTDVGDAVELRSAAVSVRAEAGRGAKITSLVHVPTGREWLVQPPGTSAPRAARYGDVFTDHPMWGWDEMFPTVDACTGLAEPFADVRLHDHGEVWSRPWSMDGCSEAAVECHVTGVALPFRLDRRLEVIDSTVTLTYCATTESADAVPVLWAAHPQFAALAGTRLRLPPTVSELTGALEGEPGPTVTVPVPSSGLQCANLLRPGEGMMVYADPETPVDAVSLIDPDGTWLRMRWDSGEVPWFAAWLDNGIHSATPVICPEPTSGHVDSLVRAQRSGRLAILRAGRPLRWTIEVTLGEDGWNAADSGNGGDECAGTAR